MMPQAVLFDWDNTLVESWEAIHEALTRTFDQMGVPRWTLGETRDRVRHSLRNSFPLLFGERWTDARDHYLAAFEQIHLDRLRPVPGARRLLDSLEASGRPAAVVSNKTGRLLRREVAALGWEHYFATVVGAGDAAADKPDRAPVDLALAATGLAAGAHVWLVGDTEVDLVCAVNAGCVPVLYAPDGEDTVLHFDGARFASLEALTTALERKSDR